MSEGGGSEAQYTPSVGTKYHADGTVRRFPGCSVVCRLAPLMPQWMVTATIVVIAAFIALTVVIANRTVR